MTFRRYLSLQVFALILEQQQGEASSDTYLISKFNLVDLAGSERAKRTKASGWEFLFCSHVCGIIIQTESHQIRVEINIKT